MNIDQVAMHCAKELAVGHPDESLVLASIIDASSAQEFLTSEYGISFNAWRVVSPAIEWVAPALEYDPNELPDECPAFTGVHIVGSTLYVVGTDGMCAGYWFFTRKA